MLTTKISFASYREGSPVYYHDYAFNRNKIILFVSEQGICGFHFIIKPIQEHIALIHKRLGSSPVKSSWHVDPWSQRLGRTSTEVILAPYGTPFQIRVWKALCAIPKGETRSYIAIAQQVRTPRGARAVAQACAQNLIAYLIPCHRVVCANGKISGYRWGVVKKQALLRLEGRDSCLLSL